ncbi:zinc finger protein 70-like [Cydia strobilella]|uniref:zinc finger protein 70-like n=1 Tax=Cydia strobilella TaxID=1100964 RepID=UPI00300552CC
MAVAGTSLGKTRGPIIDPALCRCCRSIKKCRILNSEYEWLGKKEVYSDMLMDCFGLLLSHLDGEPKDIGVCATCVGRLREAVIFRQQVLQSEQAFLNARQEKKDEVPLVETKVKVEPVPDSDASVGAHDDDHDYEPECKVEIEHKIELKSETPEKRKKTRPRPLVLKKRSKRELFDRALALQDELDELLDHGPPSPPKKLKPQKKGPDDQDHMVYHNTITIVLHSYVCPFHNRISNYYCYYCRDQFTNPVELREHTMQHKPSMFESMTENKKIPKIDITRIDCRLCPAKIETLEDFKQHISSVHNKKIFPVQNEFLKFKLTLDNIKCTECNSSFPYFDSLKKHMIEHFGTFICDQCGACFLEQNSLRTHIKSHNKVEANFPCEICGKNLKSKYSRYLHVATVHEKKPTVNCYKCDSSFLSYALRNRHLIEVHGDKRTFPCKLCDKVYNRRKTLMEHNRRNHLKVYRHHCDLCDQRFYLPSRLKEHMATHTGERNFRCEFCDKCYPRLQSLQEHVRSHSNERRYKCDICNATFTQNGSLKSHMKSHHQFELNANFG